MSLGTFFCSVTLESKVQHRFKTDLFKLALEEFEKVIESDALARKPGHKHGSLLDEDLASVVEDGNGLQRVPANPTDHLRLPVNVVAIDLDDLKKV